MAKNNLSMGKIPEIIFLLREKIEKQAGIRVETPDDFAELCDYINDELKKHHRRRGSSPLSLSKKTIERLWEREKYNSTPRLSTLNNLARVAGYKYWNDFREEVKAQLFEMAYDAEDVIPVKKMEVGTRIVFGDFPDNYCFCSYLGDGRFQVLWSIGEAPYRRGDTWTYMKRHSC